ncbi:MAG: PepSY domain-containing protein [Prochloraceae cyanobacterium]
MKINKARLRQLHSSLAPIMVLPLLITLITGVGYQIADVTGNGRDFYWMISVHTGQFGPIDLQKIYPFLNGAGLFTLMVTGITMWIQSKKRRKS